MLSVSETSPGRVVYRGEYITVISSPQVLPYREILCKFAQDDRLVFGFLPPYCLFYIKTLPSTNETKCSLRPKTSVISVSVISPYKCSAYNFLSCRFAFLSPTVLA